MKKTFKLRDGEKVTFKNHPINKFLRKIKVKRKFIGKHKVEGNYEINIEIIKK